jgi:hypothetical protein
MGVFNRVMPGRFERCDYYVLMFIELVHAIALCTMLLQYCVWCGVIMRFFYIVGERTRVII